MFRQLYKKKYYRNQPDGSISVQKELKVQTGFAPYECRLFNELNDYYNLIKGDLDEMDRGKLTDILYDLTPCYQNGQKMLKIAKLKKLTLLDDDTCSIQEGAELDFEKGIVYVLNSQSYDPNYPDYNDSTNEDLHQAFQLNPQWKGKVRLININRDFNYTNEIVEKIKSRKWKQFDHYQTDDLDETTQILINGLGYKIKFVNKQGEFFDIYFGTSQGVLVEIINGLIAESDEPEKKTETDQSTDYQTLKAECKEIKKQLKKCSARISETGFKGKVDLWFEKFSHLKPNGTKIFKDYTRLRLEYNISIDNLPQINSFLENEWKQIPENMKEVTGERFQGSYPKFLEAFSCVRADIYQEIVYYIDLSLDQAKSSFQVTKTQDQWLKAKNLDFHKWNKACGILKDQGDQDHSSFEDWTGQIKNNQLRYNQGQQFIPLINYQSLKDGQTADIEHVPGQVLVVQYWNCGGIPGNFQELVELAEKNQERWGQSVRLIVIWLLGEQQQKMEQIQQYTKYVDFYSPLIAYDPIAFDYMGNDMDRDIYYTIVDKFGTVRIKTESSFHYEVIDELFQEQVSQQIQDEGDFTEEVAQNLIDFTQQSEIKEKILQIVQPRFFDLKIHLEMHKIEGQIKFKKPILDLTYRDIQQQEVNWILQKIFQFIPEGQWKINKQEQKTISVEYPGAVCAVCQKNILQQPQQYYSPFKKEHVCVECAEFDDQTKQGAERFKYLETLIFINGPLKDLSVLTNIDDQKIGNNLQLQEGEEPNQNHGMSCDGCGVAQGARYIAANAKMGESYNFIDYCQACFLVLKDKKSGKAQEIIKKKEEYGMTEDNLLVRVLFSHGYRYF